MRAFLTCDSFDARQGWRAITASGANGLSVTTLLGPELDAPAPFTTAIPSWGATTPPGSWIEVQLRARRDGHWTRFYRIAQWDGLREASVRRSFDAQKAAGLRASAVAPRPLLYAAGRRPSVHVLRLALSWRAGDRQRLVRWHSQRGGAIEHRPLAGGGRVRRPRQCDRSRPSWQAAQRSPVSLRRRGV